VIGHLVILRPADKRLVRAAFRLRALYDEGRWQAIGGWNLCGCNLDGRRRGRSWGAGWRFVIHCLIQVNLKSLIDPCAPELLCDKQANRKAFLAYILLWSW